MEDLALGRELGRLDLELGYSARDTISRITDKVVAEMAEWTSRPLEKVYAAVFIDAIYVKIRDGQVGNRPIYAAIGVDLAGHKDILGSGPVTVAGNRRSSGSRS